MRVHRWIAIAIAMGATSSTAIAGPEYGAPLDELTLDRARTELTTMAASEGIEASTAEVLLKLDVFATSSDTGCPGVDVYVINATPKVVWGIEVQIKQKDGGNARTDTLHLPYLMPNTKVLAQVTCLQDYKSSYDYSPSGGISLSYSAKGAKSLDAALPQMIAQTKDYYSSGLYVEPSTAGRGNLLEDALAMDDPAVAKELVLAIARTGIGGKELGDVVATNGTGAIADEVATSMSKLPAAQQAALARSLLSSTAASRWQEQLSPMIENRLCTGARAEVVGLWIKAQRPDGIPVAEFRDRIREKCKPTKADGPGLVAALEKDPTNAGVLLDAVDDDLFASAVVAWKAKKQEMPRSLVAFLRETENAGRFDQAAGTIPALGIPTAISEVVGAPASKLAQHKADWVTANLGRLPEIDAAVSELVGLLVAGKVTAEPMQQVVRSLRDKSPKTYDEVILNYARESSTVFDATKLAAANVDIGAFLAFNAQHLDACTVNLDALRECMKQIAAFKEPAGTGSLQKAAADALQPAFADKMRSLVTETRDHEALVAIAHELSAAGLSTGFIADQMCRDAEDAIRYDDDAEPALDAVAAIDPNASCIGSTKDKVTARKRKAVLMTILAICGLVLPLPAGGFFVRRRFRKLQKDLPVVADDDASQGEKLDDRLGARALGRGIQEGLTEASRELAGTPAKRSLDAIDEAVLSSAVETVRRAVKSGDAASLLIRRAADAVYVVALPVRHPRPQIVQRYLGAPWPDHLQAIQRAAGVPVLAVVVLCGPEAAEASLLVGYSDGAHVSDPEVLLDAKEARERGANRFRHVMTLASTPAATKDANVDH